MRRCIKTAGATVVLFAAATVAHAYWGQVPLPDGEGGESFAVGHMPDGRHLYLVGGRAYRQYRFRRTGHSSYASVLTNSQPSFVAVRDASLAVAGYVTAGGGVLYRFDPSDLAAPGFASIAQMRSFHGVFRDAESLYVGDGGESMADIRYVTLDGATNRVVVADISGPADPAGFARDSGGDLYVGDADDGVVYRFTASQLDAAIASGMPLEMTEAVAVHDFGEGSNITSIAVDDLGRIWAGGGAAGVRVYNPLLTGETGLAPHAANAACRVAAFTVSGKSYVGCVSALAGKAVQRMYGSDLAVLYLMTDSQYPFAAGAGGSSAYDRGIPGYLGPHGEGKARLPLGNGTVINSNNYVNPIFAAWATGAEYAPADQPMAPAWTNANNALGPAEGDNTHLVSLGDLDRSQMEAGGEPGRITLEVDLPIADQEGPDFAVFENTIMVQFTPGLVFAELAYVDVSTDGTNFARFPGVALHTEETIHTNLPGGRGYAYFDPREVYNLAGKHVNNADSWGTPFDLRDLRWHPSVVSGLVDLAEIRYVRVVDIPGNGHYLDQSFPARPIVDGWLTWGSGGADIDAVGVINFQTKCLTSARPGGAGVSWFAVTNRLYQVQWSDSLHGTNWTNLGDPVPGDNADHEVIDSNKAEGARFYRVLRSPLP